MSIITPLTSHKKLQEAGIIPIRKGKLRFAVGDPAGFTSNSWGVEVRKKGDVYLYCRDNFRELKISLHASGRWRMGFTDKAIADRPKLVSESGDKAWEVWEKPKEQLPDTLLAFQLIFPTPELYVHPKKRKTKLWKGVFFIEEAPKGKVTIISLFITKGEKNLVHEKQPHFTLAIFPISQGRFVQVVAHAGNETNYPKMVNNHRKAILAELKAKKQKIGKDFVIYLHGHKKIGTRFYIGARLFPKNKFLLKLQKKFFQIKTKFRLRK